MKILVTGGTGFIGSHTVIELIQSGYDPVIVDNLSNSNISVLDGIREISGKVPNFYEIDCRNREALRQVFEIEKPEAVIHFDKNAASPYGYTKVVCEQMIKDVCHSKVALKSAILRYFNPIGAHPSGIIGELPNGVPNNLVPFITQTAIGKRDTLTVFGTDYSTPDGSCIRDFIHVVDLAKAHLAALEWLMNANTTFEIFNLGQGRGNSVIEVVKAFEALTGEGLNYKIGPRRSGDVEQIWANVDKAERLLGWKTKLGIEEGLRDAWNWEKQLQAKEQIKS
jgi:UDP-glucose-4-epimerase GalE